MVHKKQANSILPDFCLNTVLKKNLKSMEKKNLSENSFTESKTDEEEHEYLISFIVKDIQKITTLENGIKTLRNF